MYEKVYYFFCIKTLNKNIWKNYKNNKFTKIFVISAFVKNLKIYI